jgi:hypothetical protein
LTNKALLAVVERKLGHSETLELEGLLEEKIIKHALKSMPGGRAAGMVWDTIRDMELP